MLVGVNLLREGLDLPTVSLVAILDADKEGFLRSGRSLTQTAGRAARNVNGRVLMYADTITRSMQETIDETERRRAKQQAYNQEHGITPSQVGAAARASTLSRNYETEQEDRARCLAEDPVIRSMDREGIRKAMENARERMEAAAKELDFLQAARYRDEMFALKELLKP